MLLFFLKKKIKMIKFILSFSAYYTYLVCYFFYFNIIIFILYFTKKRIFYHAYHYQIWWSPPTLFYKNYLKLKWLKVIKIDYFIDKHNAWENFKFIVWNWHITTPLTELPSLIHCIFCLSSSICYLLKHLIHSKYMESKIINTL